MTTTLKRALKTAMYIALLALAFIMSFLAGGGRDHGRLSSTLGADRVYADVPGSSTGEDIDFAGSAGSAGSSSTADSDSDAGADGDGSDSGGAGAAGEGEGEGEGGSEGGGGGGGV